MSDWKKYIEYLIETARKNGAYLASSLYKPYQKVWLRDHSMISYLLMEMGYNITDEINWITELLAKEHKRVKKVLGIARNTPEFYDEGNHPAARYSPSMERYEEDWLERQYDGIALSVLLMIEYHLRSGVLLEGFVKDYLEYLYYVHGTPCASLWEMHDDHIHAYTVGLIAYTLKRASLVYKEFREKADYVREFFISRFVVNNEIKAMMKVKRYGVCSSVLLLLSRFDIFKGNSSLKDHVYNMVTRKLSPDGIGLYRYIIEETGEKDTYFGGNLWYITTYWKGNYLINRRKISSVEDILSWHFEFPLGEQIPDTRYVLDKNMYYHWIEKSKKENNGIPGPARPLSWSIAERAYLEYKIQNS